MRLRLPNKVLYWAKTGDDRNGRPTYAAPTQHRARWEDGNSETINGQGALVLSTSTVYLEGSIAVGGMMMVGDLEDSGLPTDPRTDRRAREILNVGTVPNIKGTQSLTIVKLR